MSEYVDWTRSDMVEVNLRHEDDFLKIKETLTRIGIPVAKDKKLYQSCHILHKKGKYYIVHFKELFALDGKAHTISEEDISRRNYIVKLLADWGLCEVVEDNKIDSTFRDNVKILKHSEKKDWNLVSKYDIGAKV